MTDISHEKDQKRFILWIDDDLDLLRPQRLNLLDRGYNVIIEGDVDYALEKILSDLDSIQGLIIDVMMNPGARFRTLAHQGGLRTGLLLVDYLIKEKRLTSLPIFVFTHRFDPEAAERLRLEYRINYYQKQDFKGEAIVSLVREEFDVDK